MRPQRRLSPLRDSPLASMSSEEDLPIKMTSIRLTSTRDGRRVYSRADYRYESAQEYAYAHRHDKPSINTDPEHDNIN